MNPQDTRQRVLAAHKLLTEETTSREKFELIRTLIKGVNQRIDNVLDSCSKTLSDIEKLQQGQIIELSAEKLPENTEEEKKRKRAVLLFIRSWKELQGEVERVRNEFQAHEGKQGSEQAASAGRIIAFAKGPFGIITLAAIVIVATVAVINSQRNEPTPVESSVKGETSEVTPSIKSTIQVIEFNGKQIPLSELTVGKGSECDNDEHYHAKDHTFAKARDGSTVADPGGCGFGKVKNVAVIEVEQ